MSKVATFDEETLISMLRCPESGASFESFDDHLYSAGERLYPVICGTPIVMPGIDRFLRTATWPISRAIAELGEDEEICSWFYSRYGMLDQPIEPGQVDTFIPGEGYPGFWDCLDLPSFVNDLVLRNPETVLEDRLHGTRFKLGLDLGSGQGGWLQTMATQCTLAIGVESNPYLAMLANRHLGESEIAVRYFVPKDGYRTEPLEKAALDNARVICADAASLPFEEESFDWIHCGHFLDLAEEPGSLLSDIVDFLKPGGTLTIASPLDYLDERHFDGVFGVLTRDFDEVYQEDGIPWLRYHHKRRLILHEDWLWVGVKHNGEQVIEED